MNVIEILENLGAIIRNDHFVYTSGKHGSVYIRKDMLYPHTNEVSKVGELFANKFKEAEIDVVVGPAVGGIVLSQWTAYHLSKLTKKDVLSVFTEKIDSADQLFNKNQTFKRGFEQIVKNKRVLIVEDLTTTGGSMKRVIDAVNAAEGTVVNACVMINRDTALVNEEAMGVPFSVLGELPAESFDEHECPYCKEGKPINTIVGHGKKYLDAKNPS
jgi:orotate phosphoribosyltransferase